MLTHDHFCKFLNSLVKEYHFVIVSTNSASEERKEAGKIYDVIQKYVRNYSHEALNLNKLTPQTIQFLRLRGLKIPTKRVGIMELKKNSRRRGGPKVWDYRRF